MDSFYSNDYLKMNERIDGVLIRVISYPIIDADIRDYVKKFINFRVFPYVNSLYGELVDSYYDELNESQKKEVFGLLKKQLFEIDKIVKKQIYNTSKVKLSRELGTNLLLTNKKNIYSSIKGGQFGEMFLNNLFIELGYNKIMSKLYIQWGPLSPTGIDVPYINIEKKVLVLGECKLYKDISTAIDSVMKDIDDIYINDKLDKEVLEWNAKIQMIPENVKSYLLENSISSKRELISKMNKIIVLGFVMGDCDDKIKKKIYKKIKELKDYEIKEKFELLLLVVPLDSKDKLVETCYSVIEEMYKEVGGDNER